MLSACRSAYPRPNECESQNFSFTFSAINMFIGELISSSALTCISHNELAHGCPLSRSFTAEYWAHCPKWYNISLATGVQLLAQWRAHLDSWPIRPKDENGRTLEEKAHLKRSGPEAPDWEVHQPLRMEPNIA